MFCKLFCIDWGIGITGYAVPAPESAYGMYTEGSFGNATTNVVKAIWELLRNAFIQALMPSIDHEISLKSVNTDSKEDKTFFQKIFGGGKKKEKK